MRLPLSSRNNRDSFEIVQYSSDHGALGPSRWMPQLDDKRSRILRIPIPSAMSTYDIQGEPLDDSEACIGVVIPRHRTRQTRSRGWKRLKTIGDGRKDFDTWLICGPRENTQSILIHPKLDSSRFMANLPDATPWQDLAICGTHDSSALYGFPYAQCQQSVTSITRQLHDGIRFLDLRMRVIEDDLIMYHGVSNQRAHFTDVVAEIHIFLSLYSSESLLVSIKEEAPPVVPKFAELVWAALAPHVDQFWFLETRLPNLGEVRGKAMIMPRFPIDPRPGLWDKGVGMKIGGWPDDRPEGFEMKCGEERVLVQDWYGVPSVFKIPDKLEAATHRLEPTVTETSLFRPNQTSIVGKSISEEVVIPESIHRPLTISYLSAATLMAPPNILAKGIGWPSIGLGIEGLNSRFTLWLLELMCDGKRIRGVVPVDFYAEVGEVAKLLIVMNQLGYASEGARVSNVARVSGETLVE